MRIRSVEVAVIFIFLALFLSLFNLQVIHGNRFKQLSEKNCIRLIPQEGSRGRILDREGRLIVGSVISYDVMILPQEINALADKDKLLTLVSKTLGLDLDNLKNIFKANYPAGSLMPVIIAKNIDVKKAIALEELKTDFPDLIIQPHPQRYYPYDRLASHVIGYLSQIDRWRLTKLQDYGYRQRDYVGFGGIEEKYDYYLRQEEGGFSVEVDHRGRQIRVVGFRPPVSGKDIQLTLDLEIQKVVEDNFNDRKGCIVIMEPYSGEVLALVSSPNFNPSVFVKQATSSIRNLFGDPEAPLINRATSGAYPAGSVFKLVVAAAALETGKVNLNTTFVCPGNTYVGRQEFSCWNTHNQQNLIGAIANSCNVFFYKTGLLVGAQNIHDYALKFGFAKPTGIDLPYEESGFLPSPLWKKVYRFQNWFDGDTANFAIGQGDLLVTPLQLLRLMGVFANRGNLVTPYIIKTIDAKDVSVAKRKSYRVPIKQDTLDYIREGLRQVVARTGATANILADLPVAVAGKTGTAQVACRHSHGWFVGFFPFNKPRFVICVFLENSGPGHYASVLTKQIIKAMLENGIITDG